VKETLVAFLTLTPMEVSAQMSTYFWETISTPDRIMNVWAREI
jgi:hypothetical protein